MDYKITDLVDEKALTDIQSLRTELTGLKNDYVELVNKLAAKLSLNIDSFTSLAEAAKKVNENISAMEQKESEMASKQQALTSALKEQVASMEKKVSTQTKQNAVNAQTTNTISRELAEIEKENAKKREEFQLDQRAVDLANEILGTRKANTQALVEYQNELDNVKASKKEVNRLQEEGIITDDEALARLTDLVEDERSLKALMAETQVVLKNQEKLSMDASGSYSELSHQLELMKKAYKQLNDEEKAGDRGKILSEQIQSLDAHLKDLDADMGQFQRNVGNYAVANGSLKTELRGLIQEIATLTLQYREMSDAEKQSEQGQALATKLQVMTERASVLKDTISDVNEEITHGASDTSKWDSVAGQLGIMTAGFAAATAAGKMLGLEEDELNEVQSAAVVVLGLANNAKEISNSLEKQSAVMVGISTVQHAAETKAIALKTAAEGKGVIATKAAMVAQKAFNLVAKANPYVLLAMALVTVVGALTAFAIGTSKAKDEEEKLNDELEKSKDNLSKMNDDADFGIKMAEATGASTTELRKMRFEAKKAAEEVAYLNYQQAIAAQIAGKMTKEMVEEYRQIYLEAAKATDSQMQTNIIEETKERYKAEEDLRKKAAEAANARREAQKKAEEEYKKYIEDINKQLAESQIAIIQDEQSREIAQVNASYDEKLKAIKGNTEAENELRKNLETERAMELADITEKYQQKDLELQQEASEKKMKAIEDEMSRRNDLTQGAMTSEIIALKKKYAEGEMNEQEYRDGLEKIQEKYAQDTVRNAMDYLSDVLKNENLTQDERASLEEEYYKLWQQYEEKRADATISSNERIKDSSKETLKSISEVIDQASETVSAFSDFGDQLYQNQIDKLQEQMDANDAYYDNEVAHIEELEENGSISTEEAEARKRAAKDKTEKQSEKLEKKQEELEKKQAKLAKATAIATAMMNIASSILQVLANPGNGPTWARIAQIATVSAIGAAQLATIIATPLSAYKEGTKDHKGGLAIVGDGGKQEVITFGDRAWLTPDTPTLVDMPKHSQVFPDVASYESMKPMLSGMYALSSQKSDSVKVVNDFSSLQKSVENGNDVNERLLKKILMQNRRASFESYINSRI